MLSYQTWMLSKDARMLSTRMWELSKDSICFLLAKKFSAFSTS